MGCPALLIIRRKVCFGFLSPLKKSIALTGFEPVTFGSSDKHTNHYTTKATWNDMPRTAPTKLYWSIMLWMKLYTTDLRYKAGVGQQLQHPRVKCKQHLTSNTNHSRTAGHDYSHDSNPRSQQPRGRRATSQTARPLRPRFSTGEKTSGTHWTGGWVGLRTGLDRG
jgi:hypothetical protein